MMRTLSLEESHVVALGLLGKDHGLVIVHGHGGCQSDAAGLGSEDHGHVVHIEILAEFLSDAAQQAGINPMVQKAVHLNDVAGQNLALFYNALFQLLHIHIPQYS